MIKKFAVFALDEERHEWEQFGNSFPNIYRARGFAKECAKAQAQAGAHGREFVICELVPRETVKWEGGEV